MLTPYTIHMPPNENFTVSHSMDGANEKKAYAASSMDSLANNNNVQAGKDIFTAYADRMSIIRFVSMCFIVWGHCLLGWDTLPVTEDKLQVVQAVFLQLGKMGTINFFIISGFFLGGSINEYSVPGYLRHRLFTLIIPWAIFLVLFVVIEMCQTITLQKMVTENTGTTFKLALKLTDAFIFHSAYWFVPVSVLSAISLIIFKKFVSRLWFGIILMCITAFYCINLYYGWVAVIHTKAFFGYVFFMWLGLQFRANQHQIKAYIARVPWPVLWGALIVSFSAACYEGIILLGLRSADPFASIRVTNFIVSIIVFLLLIKSEGLTWIKSFDPRKSTFGIYLVHCIIISQLTPLLYKFVYVKNFYHNQQRVMSIEFIFLMQLAFFIIIFIGSYLIVTVIKKTKLRPIIGLKY